MQREQTGAAGKYCRPAATNARSAMLPRCPQPDNVGTKIQAPRVCPRQAGCSPGRLCRRHPLCRRTKAALRQRFPTDDLQRLIQAASARSLGAPHVFGMGKGKGASPTAARRHERRRTAILGPTRSRRSQRAISIWLPARGSTRSRSDCPSIKRQSIGVWLWVDTCHHDCAFLRYSRFLKSRIRQ